MTRRTLDRMIYIDDSGHPQSGLIVYGWIEFHPDHWHEVLRSWLTHRKSLWAHYGIPVTEELHMTHYALGRGRISQRPPRRFIHGSQTYWKDLGREVAQKSLETMRSTEGLRVGAVYRQGARENYAAHRAETYAKLIACFEAEMDGSTSLAMLFMDGDGSDPTYRTAHRQLRLRDRRIIEDPVYTDSKSSQLMQMADHVAWCANASIARVSQHRFAHDWYSRYLAPRDPRRSPSRV
jgi:hypothetical protein